MAGGSDARFPEQPRPRVRVCPRGVSPTRRSVRRGASMLTSRHLEASTSTVACPRCGSELVVPARSGDASEYVFQLRDGSAPAARADAFDEWLCTSCGQRWPHETLYARSTAETGGPSSDAALPDDLMALVDLPEVSADNGVTSPRVDRVLWAAREGRGLVMFTA